MERYITTVFHLYVESINPGVKDIVANSLPESERMEDGKMLTKEFKFSVRIEEFGFEIYCKTIVRCLQGEKSAQYLVLKFHVTYKDITSYPTNVYNL